MELEQFTKDFMNTGSSTVFYNWMRWLKEQQAPFLVLFLYEMTSGTYSFSRELLLLVAECYLSVGAMGSAWSVYMDLLTSSLLTEEQSNRIWIQAHQCIESIKDRYISYPEQKIKLIVTNNIPLPLITFTITTCKRLDLFERTMNSFIHCCEDIHLITHWICVDDNSSSEDREQMKRKYPFFKFIFKTKEQKGHAQSMNLLREHIQTPYVFHMEDDWQFIVEKPYMSDCLEVLNDNPIYGQCLINRNYAEIATDVFLKGGYPKQTSNGARYYEHEYDPQGTEFQKKYGKVANCAYWPHYSLRPSLLKTNVWSALGAFNPDANHFEMDYSYKYTQTGLKSVFLEGVSCLHIGRLTRDRFDTTKKNAYTLNDEEQFIKKTKSKTNIFVVNLDDRQDRMSAFEKEVSELKEPLNVDRFPAVNGYTLKEGNIFLEQLFEHNDYNFRRGMVGCALSHLQLWIQLLNDADFQYYIIFEDDIEFVPYFKMKLDYILQQSFDILFLGHHARVITPQTHDKHSLPSVEAYTTQRSFQESKGGTGGYVITKEGARKMLDFIQERSMTNGIDTMMQKACDSMQVCYATPHLIYSPCCDVVNNTVDTDIQRNYDSLKMDTDERVRKEKEYYIEQGFPIKEVYGEEDILDLEKVNVIHNDYQRIFPEEGIHYTIHDQVHVYLPASLTPNPFRLRNNNNYTLQHLI